jgi:hypothetical protein
LNQAEMYKISMQLYREIALQCIAGAVPRA